MEILVQDLPGDTTEEQLREYLRPFGDINSLTLTNEGNNSRATATVDMPVSAAIGEVIVERIRQKPFNGHNLRAEVLLFFK